MNLNKKSRSVQFTSSDNCVYSCFTDDDISNSSKERLKPNSEFLNRFVGQLERVNGKSELPQSHHYRSEESEFDRIIHRKRGKEEIMKLAQSHDIKVFFEEDIQNLIGSHDDIIMVRKKAKKITKDIFKVEKVYGSPCYQYVLP
jgi:hypothetical protein